MEISRDYGSLDPMDTSTSQLLHPRLRDHCSRGCEKISKSQNSQILCCNGLKYLHAYIGLEQGCLQNSIENSALRIYSFYLKVLIVMVSPYQHVPET